MAWVDIKRTIRQYSRDYRYYWTLACIIGGAILFFFSFMGVFNIKELNVSIIKGFNVAVGYWMYWIFIASIILLIVGIGYFYGHVNRLKEFHELMDTESKAQFRRNQSRIEYLGWRLGQHFEQLVNEKKTFFKIK